MRALILAVMLVLLAACNGVPKAEPHIPKTTQVPVPTPCIDPSNVPKAPRTWSEPELLALPEYQRTLTLWIAYFELLIYTAKLEVIADRCSRLSGLRLSAGK